MKGGKIMKNEAKFDKRLIALGYIPAGYDEYIKSLPCLACGSIEPCECTAEDYNDKR